MREQTGAWNSPQQPRRQAAYIPADVLDEDALYTRRAPSSVRRYVSTIPTTTPPRVAIRVTKHQGPPPIQRASRLTADQQAAAQPARPKEHWRPHWLASVGLGMLATLLLAGGLSALLQWWQGQQDALQYGYPRTFQCDQDVRHRGMSHFIAENLNGHIFVIEMQASDLARTKIYQGPTIFGQQTDLQPVTLTFQDVNADGYPDMIVAVNHQRYVFINDHTAFRPATPTDKIERIGG